MINHQSFNQTLPNIKVGEKWESLCCKDLPCQLYQRAVVQCRARPTSWWRRGRPGGGRSGKTCFLLTMIRSCGPKLGERPRNFLLLQATFVQLWCGRGRSFEIHCWYCAPEEVELVVLSRCCSVIQWRRDPNTRRGDVGDGVGAMGGSNSRELHWPNAAWREWLPLFLHGLFIYLAPLCGHHSNWLLINRNDPHACALQPDCLVRQASSR